MRRDYERFTKADSYIVGFDMNGLVYGANLDKIPRRYIKIQKECSKAGGGYGLYINVKSMKARKELMKKAVENTEHTRTVIQNDKGKSR